MNRRDFAALGMMGLGLGLGRQAVAQSDFPNRPVKIVVPHQTGSTTETFGRMIAIEMGELLGQPIVIESRPGAAGTIGAREVAMAKPDGYTGLMNASIQVMYPGMFKSLAFDPLKDFTPVGIFGLAPMVVVVGAQSKLTTFKDMVDAARANPGKLSFASGGLGSLPHLVGELVDLQTGGKISHVPYNGTGQATTDVAGGHVDILYASVASAVPLIKSGRLRALAVTSGSRIDALPDVRTIAESGLPGFDVTSWYALWMPKGTPADAVARLNKAMRDASRTPTAIERMKLNGVLPSAMTADQFARFCQTESTKWLEVMKKANIQSS
jgi:tripartite-type tricarboxylate transporter receptor subunit TctC